MTPGEPSDLERHAAETARSVTGRRKRVVLVAAVADNGVIGRGGDIPWHLPEDLRHFRATTMGHTVLMGRRTYDSIGRPLPGRANVVVTRNRDWSAEGVCVVHSVSEGIERCQDLDGDVMVIGGGDVYAAVMPVADAQVLTEVHAAPEGDTYYPDWDRSQWREVSRTPHAGYDFVWWERIPPERT
jgi:dihydrofolate reductase